MRFQLGGRRLYILLLLAFTTFFISACNLTSAPEEQLDVTEVPTNSMPPTRTPFSDSAIPTVVTTTPLPLPTSQAQVATAFPTAIPPATAALSPSATPLPVSIFIRSPIPGNVIASNVQIIGSASHPDFLQYILEFGPDPNPGNTWFPITGGIQTPILNDLLGIWNTTTVQDGFYQLRLRVFLRDGSEYSSVVVNSIQVQNQAPTPVPTNTPIIPAPIAAFTQDRVSGNSPLVVRFTSQSTGQITDYLWNFGDDSTSTAINPAHTFNNPGTYTVTLTVAGPGGASNVSRQINVQSPQAPVAAFTADTTSGTAPLRVQLISQSTGEITDYLWNFGDGESGFGQSIIHEFTEVGTYNVILRVTGPGGSSTATRQITVENPQIPPPVAAFTPNERITGDVPLQVQFNSQSTGEITSHNWDFGDGSLIAVERNPIHTFTEAGVYTVILTVVGPGGQDTAQVEVEAIQPPDVPVANLSITSDASGEAPFTVSLRNNSTGEITSTLWEFGDGEQSTSNARNLTYDYAEPGTYTIRLTVANESGSDTDEAQITVLTPITPPDALFTANRESGVAPLSVRFRNRSSGDNLTFLWEFGDSPESTTTSSAETVTHTYNEAGNYTVRLTASNESAGLSDTHELQISVSEPVAQLPELTANFTASRANNPLRFNLAATASGGTGEYTYIWDFGNGTTGTGETTNVVYSTFGEYTITLTVDDGSGNAPTVISQVVTALEQLDASFTTTPDQANPQTVIVEGSASGGTAPYTFSWDFTSDGVEDAVGQQQQFTYQPGDYTITLTVTDSAGSDPLTVQNPVSIAAPLDPLDASFTITPDQANPQTVMVDASASGGTAPYTFSWDFTSDGVEDAVGQQQQFTYQPGDYTITLTVTDSAGSDPLTVQNPVSIAAPLDPLDASFTITPDQANPQTVMVEASASGGTAPYTFSWDFTSDGVEDAIGQQQQFTYQPGDYTITLTVTDSAGSDPLTVQNPVSIAAPLDPLDASFTITPDQANPQTVMVEGSASGGTAPYTFSWDFTSDGVEDAVGQQQQFTYQPGDYTITLTVTDSAGSDPLTVQNPVSIAAPLDPLDASFTITPDQANPQTVMVEGSASGGTAPYTFSWDFTSDGVEDAVGQQQQFTYQPGDYTITLTVTDSAGSDPLTVQNPVSIAAPLAPLDASFTITPDQANPQTVMVEGSASGGTAPYTFSWDFTSDGVEDAVGQQQQFTYQPGDYTITLTVTDSAGSDPLTVQNPVSIAAPLAPLNASFTITPDQANPQTVIVDASASGGTAPYTFSWDFTSDGVEDAQGESVQLPAQPGDYPVTLTVSDSAGMVTTVGPQTVTVSEVVSPEGPGEGTSLQETTPVQPDLQGMQLPGRFPIPVDNLTRFAIVGDRTAQSDTFLRAFAALTPETIVEPNIPAELSSIILGYLSTDIGDGTNSFSRESVAIGEFTTQQLLDAPGPGACEGAANLIACELDAVNPGVVIINVGYDDALQGTDPVVFRANLEQIVALVIDRNILPILVTIYPVSDQAANIEALNEVVINVAQTQEIPLVNMWRAIFELSQTGNGIIPATSDLAVAPQGPTVLAADVRGVYGANLRNYEVLTAMDTIVRRLIP